MDLPFETSTGFLLSRIGSVAQRSWLGLLAEHGVTPHQHALLLVLQQRGPTGQHELTRVIGVDPRNVVSIIDGLVESGLVIRTIDPEDRRRRLVSLTASGRAAAAVLARGAAEVERDFLAGLPSPEQADLNRLLRRLLDSLERPDSSRGQSS